MQDVSPVLVGHSVPRQLNVFLPDNWDPQDPQVREPGWLYCLEDTEFGERQVIWEGGGRGLVAVIDFRGEIRERKDRRGFYEGWGRLTPLSPLAWTPPPR
jgi:hypothetical protein